MSEKTEGIIKDEQSRETLETFGTQDTGKNPPKTQKTTQKTKKICHTDPHKKTRTQMVAAVRLVICEVYSNIENTCKTASFLLRGVFSLYN